jgi:hypothetical protein
MIQLSHHLPAVDAKEIEDIRIVREGNKLRKPLTTENDPSDFLQSTD